ncbi:MAG TPA: alanine racemase [Gemmatimonadaceae bacterium]|jgi:alanine racemase
MQSLLTRAWVEIDLGALLRNGARVAEFAAARLLPMVKADAYGLGATRVACALQELDPWGFGVATVGEGDELRRAGIDRPILVFTPLLIEEFDTARRARLTPTLGSAEAIREWARAGLPWHLAIDTGMNRAGVSWREVAQLRDVVAASPPQGVFTHFHSAERADGSREEQEKRFAHVLAELPVRPEMIHAENSPAVARHSVREKGRWTLARPGIFLYGVGSGDGAEIAPDPVVSLRARVVDTRDIEQGDTVSYGATFRADGRRRIATLAIGYADGYRRALSNIGTVLVRGRRAPVAGLVTMDMTMIDVTNIPCEIGDVVTLIGADGDERLTVADVAASADLSPYEVLTGLRSRLPRRYVNDTAHPEGDE